jgi:hypothetical protein
MTDDMTAIGTCRILWVLVQIITLVTGSGVGGPQRAKSIHANNTVEAKIATIQSNM